MRFVDTLDGGSAQAQLILMAIARHACATTGSCYPSSGTIATESRCVERTVRRHLRALARRGLISITPRIDDHGSQRSNTITLVGYAAWATERAGQSATGGQDVPPGQDVQGGQNDHGGQQVSAPPGQQLSARKHHITENRTVCARGSVGGRAGVPPDVVERFMAACPGRSPRAIGAAIGNLYRTYGASMATAAIDGAWPAIEAGRIRDPIAYIESAVKNRAAGRKPTRGSAGPKPVAGPLGDTLARLGRNLGFDA